MPFFITAYRKLVEIVAKQSELLLLEDFTSDLDNCDAPMLFRPPKKRLLVRMFLMENLCQRFQTATYCICHRKVDNGTSNWWTPLGTTLYLPRKLLSSNRHCAFIHVHIILLLMQMVVNTITRLSELMRFKDEMDTHISYSKQSTSSPENSFALKLCYWGHYLCFTSYLVQL